MHVELEEAAAGVFLVEGSDTNWVLVTDDSGGREVTVVDAGYPGDLPRLLASLDRIGRSPADVAAIVLTHAHPDHIGSSERLRREHQIPVRVAAPEQEHARGERIEQISELAILRMAWRPRVLSWALGIVRAGATRVERLRVVSPFEEAAGALDVPGRLVPVPTPGHTTGHCSFHLPERGVVIAGDALMTAHPVAARTGPQLLPRPFQHNLGMALASLSGLEPLAADVVLPGHGPAFHGSPADAVRIARQQARG